MSKFNYNPKEQMMIPKINAVKLWWGYQEHQEEHKTHRHSLHHL